MALGGIACSGAKPLFARPAGSRRCAAAALWTARRHTWPRVIEQYLLPRVAEPACRSSDAIRSVPYRAAPGSMFGCGASGGKSGS